MNIGIYLYDGYDETEVCIPSLLFRKENITVLSSDQEIVKCMDGRKMLADKSINDIDPKDIDVLIIPGGMPLIKDDILEFIRKLEKNNSVIGGICGGVEFLARAGVLSNRTYTGYFEKGEEYDFLPTDGNLTYAIYESDRNVLTARPEGYLEFAIEIYHMAGLEMESPEGYVEWFKSPFAWKKK